MSNITDNLTNRGVKQDFPSRGNVVSESMVTRTVDFVNDDNVPTNLSVDGLSTTAITTTGSKTGTLPDGVEGATKIIVGASLGESGDFTLTVTNFANGSTITFNSDGDSVLLTFAAGQWHVVSNYGAIIA